MVLVHPTCGILDDSKSAFKQIFSFVLQMIIAAVDSTQWSLICPRNVLAVTWIRPATQLTHVRITRWVKRVHFAVEVDCSLQEFRRVHAFPFLWKFSKHYGLAQI